MKYKQQVDDIEARISFLHKQHPSVLHKSAGILPVTVRQSVMAERAASDHLPLVIYPNAVAGDVKQDFVKLSRYLNATPP